MTRELVTRIPDARLVTLDGLWADQPEALVRRVAGFLNEGGLPDSPRQDRVPSGVRTVLFTDLVGHTEVMRRLGDARGREFLREHERITREAIAKHGGTEIKTDGDSFMVSFGSVAAAMDCAVGLQRAFAARNDGAVEPLRVRIGLNAGEPIEDKGDLFGEAVILAARIKDQADAGEILIAEPVRHLLAGKGFVFADRGEFLPKGFEDSVRLFEVRWQEG
jgi:class 3 adenylate cyclase